MREIAEMDISYYKGMEPFWGVWRIRRLIGEGSFGKVFEIEREDFGRVYKAALKVITIPQSESELKSVLADGMDERSATEYYKSFVMEVVGEFSLMAELKGNSNIVSYEDHMVVEHQDGIGWDILIRMELLTPLLEYTTAVHPMGREAVIRLGIDMCRALEYCRKQNIIHRDIKPENIFVSPSGNFKLGDFGIARTAEKTMSGLSRKGTYAYMAPEVYKGEEYGASVDIYSLGIVLYRLLNKNRTPFLPVYPAPITHSERENAIVRRIAGNPMPLPVDAQDKLGEIVLKACSFLPKDRYASPGQMRMELESFSPQEERTVFLKENEEATVLLPEAVGIAGQGAVGEVEKGKRRLGLLAGVCAVVVSLIAVGVLCVGTMGRGKEENANSDEVLREEEMVKSDSENFAEAEEHSETEEIPAEMSDVQADREEGSGKETEATAEEVGDDSGEAEDMVQSFGLNRESAADYGNALEPQTYKRYDSGYADFCFSYPSNLYRDVLVDRENYASDYGENIENIKFMGSDGSKLIFALSKRIDEKGMGEMTEFVHSFEGERLYEPVELINSASEDHGKVIFTGYEDPTKQMVIYDMTKIEEDYIMQMLVFYPNTDSQEDKDEKWYVVECLYRLCGFSDTKHMPRTFGEYMESTEQ